MIDYTNLTVSESVTLNYTYDSFSLQYETNNITHTVRHNAIVNGTVYDYRDVNYAIVNQPVLRTNLTNFSLKINESYQQSLDLQAVASGVTYQ